MIIKCESQSKYVIPLMLWPDEPLGFMGWLRQHDLALKVSLDHLLKDGCKRHVHYR